MNILLHICCGPCASACVEQLREAGHEVTGFWFNPNVQPFQEYARRLEAARSYAEQADLRLIVHDEFSPNDFLQAVVFREDARCPVCYAMRLRRTAAVAKSGSFDAFTTTLLISPHQQHDVIRTVGEQLAGEVGVDFQYEDFRPVFRRHYELAERFGLYRQQYCGCIYSEYDRFAPRRTKEGTKE